MALAVVENMVGLSVCKFMYMQVFLFLLLIPLSKLAKFSPLDTAVGISRYSEFLHIF